MLNPYIYPGLTRGSAPQPVAGTAPVATAYKMQPSALSTPSPMAYTGSAMPMPMPTPISGPIPGAVTQQPAASPVFEESYIENILRLNLGKPVTVYMTFENNDQWNAKIFKGRLEAAGRDHIIISDPSTGMRYLLLMVNLDYITFDEELNYEYPGYPAGR